MTKVLFKRKTSDEIATLPVEDGALIYNYETGATYLDYDDERIPTGGGMPTGDTFPIGAITSYAGSTAPTNWLICDGRAISRFTYSDLFNAIGTTYGSGDGNTTFNLPNLKGRVITGLDTSQTEFDALGETGGEKEHTLTVEEMPSHSHDLTYVKSLSTPLEQAGFSGYNPNNSGLGTKTNAVDNTGGGQAHNNLQPYITLNYIIKAFQSAGTVANVSATTTSSDTDTYSCNYINQNNTYSTSETLTGKIWIDGKPIYRKVVLINSISGTNVNEIAVPTNIDTMLPNVCGIVYDNSGNGYFINYNNVYNTGQDIGAFYYKAHNCISIKQYAEFNINNGYIIIEYTKTTD